MHPKSYFLLISLIAGIVILAGLVITIIGIVKQKKSWIAFGVLIALIPTIVSLLYKLFN